MTQDALQTAPVATRDGTRLRAEPDLEFIRRLSEQAGPTYRRCFQCGTCSGTCALSTNSRPFPRKEMAWAVWGLKQRLLADPDVWLCHQCSDCSEHCPRGAKPGEVLSAVRRECILSYSAPGFLARWVNTPSMFPFLLAIPAVLLSALVAGADSIEGWLGITRNTTERVVYSYTPELPHWLINTFFFTFSFLALLSAIVGVGRFWRALKQADESPPPVQGVATSLGKVLLRVFKHEDFTQCERSQARSWSHLLVMYGFLALSLVTLWVITSVHNPLIADGFVYPMNFWDPWKVLANIGGAALLVGCVWMAVGRLWDSRRTGVGTWFDWSLLIVLFSVVLTGFAAEAMHYIRLEPHRHAIYFLHLILIFYLIIYLPFSKFAHVLYRTTALVYSEHTGRHPGTKSTEKGGRA